jgi:hypothetical protein
MDIIEIKFLLDSGAINPLLIHSLPESLEKEVKLLPVNNKCALIFPITD